MSAPRHNKNNNLNTPTTSAFTPGIVHGHYGNNQSAARTVRFAPLTLTPPSDESEVSLLLLSPNVAHTAPRTEYNTLSAFECVGTVLMAVSPFFPLCHWQVEGRFYGWAC